MRKNKAKNRIAEYFGKSFAFFARCLTRRPGVTLFSVSFLLNIFLETLFNRSFSFMVSDLFSEPGVFMLNTAVVMVTLSIALFFKQKAVVMGILALLWTALGIANFVVLGYRAAPLTAIDIILLRSVFDVIYIYLSPIQIVLIAAGIAAAVAAAVYLWIHVPRINVKPIRSALSIAFAFCAFFLLLPVASEEGSIDFSSIDEKYSEKGFAYSFCSTFFDRGIDEPENYDRETMRALYHFLEEGEGESAGEAEPEKSELPNIIIVQLESFFDPKRIDGAEYSEDPIPEFTALREKYPSGYLTVPVLGAGTVNTEFEVLCGISSKLFGTGEYPYDTVLKESFCENIASILGGLGYRTTAIHNNAASFYDRDLIFANMGFDDFISIEDMPTAEQNPLGWAKDAVLTEHTLNALAATEEKDLVFVVSVQPHGKYLDEDKMGGSAIDAYNIPNSDELMGYEYYLGQLKETDAFVGELAAELSALSEPTVVVFYGDHLPSFDWEDSDLTEGTLYDTEYVIMSNFGLETEAPDLCSYELTPYLLTALGIDGGDSTKLYNKFSKSENYIKYMHLLAYDKLYGFSAVEITESREEIFNK